MINSLPPLAGRIARRCALLGSLISTFPIMLLGGTTPHAWQQYFGGVQGTAADWDAAPWLKTVRISNDVLAFPFYIKSETGVYIKSDKDGFDDLLDYTSYFNPNYDVGTNSNPLVLDNGFFDSIIGDGRDWIYGITGWHNRSECDVLDFMSRRIENRTANGRAFNSDIWRKQVYQKCRQFVLRRIALHGGSITPGRIYWQLGNELTDSRGPKAMTFWLRWARLNALKNVAPDLMVNPPFPYPAYSNLSNGEYDSGAGAIRMGDAKYPDPLLKHNWTDASVNASWPATPTTAEWNDLNTVDADTAYIPYLVEYYMLPAIEAIRKINSEIDSGAIANANADDKITILLGSVSGTSNQFNRKTYIEALLNYVTLKPNHADSFTVSGDPYGVCQQPLKNLLDGVTYHYVMSPNKHGYGTDGGNGAYTWRKAYLEDIYPLGALTKSTGPKSVFATEEIGDQRWTAGEGASHALRTVARYLDTWSALSPTPSKDKVRVTLFGWLGLGRKNAVGNESLWLGIHTGYGPNKIRDNFKLENTAASSSSAFGDCPDTFSSDPADFTPASTDTIASTALNSLSSFTGQSQLTRLNTYTTTATGSTVVLGQNAPAIIPTGTPPVAPENIESYSFAVGSESASKRVVIVTPQYDDSMFYTNSGTAVPTSPKSAPCNARIRGISLKKGLWSTGSINVTAYRYSVTGKTTYSNSGVGTALTVQATASGWDITFPSTIDLNNANSPDHISDYQEKGQVWSKAQETVVFLIEKI